MGMIDELIDLLELIPNEGPLVWLQGKSFPKSQSSKKNEPAKRSEKTTQEGTAKKVGNPSAKEQKNKGGGDGSKTSKTKPPATNAEPEGPLFSQLDIRVGRILRAWKHPDAESLYIEHIDLGEEQPRQVVSGLVKYVSQDQMTNAAVLVITNLKPAAMRGVMSYGMVLAASNADRSQVELVRWPVGSHLGERLGVEGEDLLEFPPAERIDSKKKNSAFNKCVPQLRTNEHGIACFDGHPLLTSAGYCYSTLRDAQVS